MSPVAPLSFAVPALQQQTITLTINDVLNLAQTCAMNTTKSVIESTMKSVSVQMTSMLQQITMNMLPPFTASTATFEEIDREVEEQTTSAQGQEPGQAQGQGHGQGHGHGQAQGGQSGQVRCGHATSWWHAYESGFARGVAARDTHTERSERAAKRKRCKMEPNEIKPTKRVKWTNEEEKQLKQGLSQVGRDWGALQQHYVPKRVVVPFVP